MEQYEKLELEIIPFEEEDVIVTSVVGPVVPGSIGEDSLFGGMWDEEDE